MQQSRAGRGEEQFVEEKIPVKDRMLQSREICGGIRVFEKRLDASEQSNPWMGMITGKVRMLQSRKTGKLFYFLHVFSFKNKIETSCTVC